MTQESPANRPAILVVEDEIMIAFDLQRLLEDEGYEVLGPAATVASALMILNQRRVDACFLDVNLRGEHSAPVASVLRSKNIPFVLCSAYSEADLSQHDWGGAVNIGKLPTRAELMGALASLLNVPAR